MRATTLITLILLQNLLTSPQPSFGDEVKKKTVEARSVEQLAKDLKPSVVVISHIGRDGEKAGVGSGFVIDAKGLIATNYHVIGNARPITVQLANGKSYRVTQVYASDQKLDLAIIHINEKGLTPIPLGDSKSLKQGQSIVAMGNPQGLKHSVVSGVISGTRQVQDLPMIQVAIPIEPGNSGGPLIDMHGKALGIITLKSAISNNLGFAMPINALKSLLKKPNPIAMERWLTIGKVDKTQWTTLFGSTWRQRAGRIYVDGRGDGFGGRSLCLMNEQPKTLPFEFTATVHMENEKGAAGLAFASDGNNKHYGFYPSNGRLRLTRFDGPDVYAWKVLKEAPSKAYRPGDWNTLKVRIEKKKIICYVNETEVFNLELDTPLQGKIGLAKFRDTSAQFKLFNVGKTVATNRVTDAQKKRIEKAIAPLNRLFDHNKQSELPATIITQLQADHPATSKVLIDRAKLLEHQAKQLRELAQAVHFKSCQQQLAKTLNAPEEKINLLRASLLIALMDNNELDVNAYEREVKRMANQIKTTITKDASESDKLKALNHFLFKENGFHGSRTDYYNRANSYMNEVIDDREGLPITLSILYIELANQLGVKVVGIGLPGHFVVQHVPRKGKPQLIDVFDNAKSMTKQDAADILFATTGSELRDEHLKPTTKREMALRMLANLMSIAFEQQQEEGPLRYLDTVLTIKPDTGQERWIRMMLRARTKRFNGALSDADWLIENQPAGVDIQRVMIIRKSLKRELDRQPK